MTYRTDDMRMTDAELMAAIEAARINLTDAELEATIGLLAIKTVKGLKTLC